MLIDISSKELKHCSAAILDGYKLTKGLPLTRLLPCPRNLGGTDVTWIVALDVGCVHGWRCKVGVDNHSPPPQVYEY